MGNQFRNAWSSCAPVLLNERLAWCFCLCSCAYYLCHFLCSGSLTATGSLLRFSRLSLEHGVKIAGLCIDQDMCQWTVGL